ncbi:hypothetical protein [Planobispora longispora]|uniref:hypothetical protein n=1 Tax=Planobispora longispora TaxID=28887 RepID=UPI001942D0FC|nr:hypothetical protein [Planobispora longispora]
MELIVCYPGQDLAARALRVVSGGKMDLSEKNKIDFYGEALAGASTVASRASRAAKVCQKAVYGQRISLFITLGPQGWSGKSLSRFKEHFEPRVGPIGGGGDIFLVNAFNAKYVGRIGGLSDHIGPVSQNGAFQHLGKVSKRFGVVGGVFNLGSTCAKQLSQDVGLPAVERGARMAYRAVAKYAAGRAGTAAGGAVGAYAGAAFTAAMGAFISGAASGAATGAAAGTIVTPGVGTAVGAVLLGVGGGVAGAIAAGKAADMIVDRTIDPVGKAANKVREYLARKLSEIVD